MATREQTVHAFHAAMDIHRNEPLTVDLLRFRQRLMAEETREMVDDVDKLCALIETGATPTAQDIAPLLKELADIQYVLSGFAVTFGLPLENAFIRVHQSNMSKLVDGKPLKRPDGKVLKGPNYRPPEMEDLINSG
ncbi:MAG: nucleoside triphosphate pyrophosphohydrolase family protein [Pseudomonadota bacterium]|nr:nucleoside triphosphate pyrophosphohydrolase family protein [Pseudomonadota bacterium]